MCMALGVARAEKVGIVAVSGHQLNLHKALSGASMFPRGEGMTSGAHQSENERDRYAVRGSGATAVTTALLMILPERLFGLPQCAVTATGRARLAVVLLLCCLLFLLSLFFFVLLVVCVFVCCFFVVFGLF